MREIKFRCWYDNYMHRVSNIEFQHKSINLFAADTIGFEKGVLMQYTGLKDINGKEIYEGDIVRKLIWSDEKYILTNNGHCYDYAKISYIEEIGGFYIVNRNDKICWEIGQDKYCIEVCGNIYENPELLGDSNE